LTITEPFREPVDWENIGLLDYPEIVKQPMDLGTLKVCIHACSCSWWSQDASCVQRKLQKGGYKNVQDAARDMRLIWTNCMTYNQVFCLDVRSIVCEFIQDGSEFYHLADTFAKTFEEKYAEVGDMS
jgi:hypothetical protein